MPNFNEIMSSMFGLGSDAQLEQAAQNERGERMLADGKISEAQLAQLKAASYPVLGTRIDVKA